jgi:hypothetical protein
MAIVFQCACGKQLRTGEEYAGRRIKCPGCQSVLVVPAAATERDAVTAAPRRSAARPAGGLVRFNCDCGQPMQTQAEYAGKRTKCPACGTTLTIPGSSPETQAYTDRPARAARRPADDYDRDRGWDEEEGEGPRRRAPRRPAKRSVWPWVAAAAALLLLVGGGVGAWLLFFRGSGAAGPDLALVPHDALGFVSVRVADLWNSDAGKKIQEALPPQFVKEEIEDKLGLAPGDIERATFVMPTQDEKTFWAVVLATKDFNKDKMVKSFGSDTKEEKAGDKTYYVSAAGKRAFHLAGPKLLILGEPDAVKNFVEGKKPPAKSGPLDDALDEAAGGKHHLVAAFQVPASAMQQFKNPRGPAPPQMQPFMALTEIKSGAVTADLGSEVQLDVRMTFPDSDKAAAAKKAMDQLIPLAKFGLKMQLDALAKGGQGELAKQAEQALQNLSIEQSGSVVRIPLHFKADMGQLAKFVVPELLKAREKATRQASQNNLRELALAMHKYQDAYLRFPPARTAKGLSWRVLILPYIGQEALFKEFHINEPWDSPHNKALLPRMPKVFAPPGGAKTKEPYSTFYQVFTGRDTPFPTGREMRMADFVDGTFNTLLILEGGEAVPWTKPDDIAYDANRVLPKLGGAFTGGFNAALADGSVHWFNRAKLSDATLRGAITPAGREHLGVDWFTARGP